MAKLSALSKPVLSLFPGIDLLGRGFEAEGFCVVRGPDVLWGGDIVNFHPPCESFEGIIGGSPCQDFSAARRSPPSGMGVWAIAEFARVVTQSKPEWWLLENVPGVPDVSVNGYHVQRFNLTAAECGCRQRRLRTFQFGDRCGGTLVIERGQASSGCLEGAAMASEAGRQGRRSWADFCELQGLPRDFDLPGLSLSAKYRAVGNGVPIPMARVVAAAVKARCVTASIKVCVCECGRPVKGNQVAATPSCRKRMQRRREEAEQAQLVAEAGEVS